MDTPPHLASKGSLPSSGSRALEEGTLPCRLVGHVLLGHPGPRRQFNPRRGEQGLGEALRTAEGKAPPWMLPNPSDMGIHCSRNRMTINRKNLLSQCCQACHRASAGLSNAPLSSLAEALMLSQVEEGIARVRGFHPWSETLHQQSGQSPKPRAQGFGSGLTQWDSSSNPVGALLGTGE